MIKISELSSAGATTAGISQLAQTSAAHQTRLNQDLAAERLAEVQLKLANERRHPWKQLFDLVGFRVLTALTRLSPPLPSRTATRFARSAFKKDPNRSLFEYGADGGASELQINTGRGWSETKGQQTADPQKKNILIVSHDASMTGAPILAVNLMQSLSLRFNVTAMVLGRGAMRDAFKVPATHVYSVDGLNDRSLGKVIALICKHRKFEFAVINTAASRAVLPPLKTERVPTVSLQHEFTSYLRSSGTGKSPYQEVFETASEVVFSTQLTLDAAKIQNPMIDMSAAHVLPQGRCRVPVFKTDVAKSSAEKAWLRHMLRPEGSDEKRIVVIGAGTVSLRKGVDLFIETATRVVKSEGAENVHFFWIGPKYAPDHDVHYSSYLRDQIMFSGIAPRITMVRETTEIDAAYALADIFVLSSRLDPLPNVTIDALSVGLPVVCFERTTGIADLLVEADLKEPCVAAFIDTAELAQKVLALATNATLRAEVAAKSREYAAKAFDFEAYARKIEALGLAAAAAQRKV